MPLSMWDKPNPNQRNAMPIGQILVHKATPPRTKAATMTTCNNRGTCSDKLVLTGHKPSSTNIAPKAFRSFGDLPSMKYI